MNDCGIERRVMRSVRIRRAASNDIGELGRIEVETARMFASGVLPPHLVKPVPAPRLLDGIADSMVWVAEHESRPVGFVLAERHGASLHIGEIDVHPEFGRRGIGRSLVAHVCEVAAALGLRFVTLTTLRDVPWNAPFYTKLGFVCVTELRPFLHLQHALRHDRRIGLRRTIAMVRRSGQGPWSGRVYGVGQRRGTRLAGVPRIRSRGRSLDRQRQASC